MRQIDEATSVGEADDVPVEEAAVFKPKIKPTMVPGVPGVGDAATPAPISADTLPPVTAAPNVPASVPPPVAPPATPAPLPAPAPAPAPIQTMTGEWTPPTASAQSAPLIASAAGGTMTPEGDSANSFRGYQTAQGGGFGGAFAEKGADAPLWSSVSNGDPQAIQKALSASDPALQQAAADAVSRMLTMNDTQAGGIQMLKNLSPEARALVQKTYLGPTGGYAPDQAGYSDRTKYAKAYQDSWDRIASGIDTAPAGLPVGRLEGNYTAKDPAEQARLLASGATAGLPTAAPAAPAAPTLPGGAPEGAVFKPNILTTTTGGQNAGAPAPSGGAGSPAGGLPGIGAAPSGAFTTKPTDPNNPLTSQTIDYGDLTNRFKVAQDELANWNKTSDPQFQADLRDAMRKAAAGGALGSGMLQTSLGDITANRELQRQGMGTSFLNNALTGSIQDAKDRTALAERQQGFQADQQRTAFGQGVTEAQLNEALTSGAFQRALQQLVAGSSGNPADIQLALSQIFGNQAGTASDALGGLIQNKTANTGNAGTMGYLEQLLAALQKTGGGTASTSPTSTTVYGGQ